MWKCKSCNEEINRVSYQKLNKDLSYEEEYVRFECQYLDCNDSSEKLEDIAEWED